jgi:ankyrin repeat protein
MKHQTTENELSLDQLLKILGSANKSSATKINYFNQAISAAPAMVVFLNPNIRIQDQPIPYHLAEIGNLTALRLLLKSRPYLLNQVLDDETGITLVHKACIYGHLEIIKFLLLEKQAQLTFNKRGRHPIHCAVMYNHLPIVKFLIQTYPALIELRRKEDRMTPLLIAAHEDHIEIFNWLLVNHANPYKRGKYPEFNLLELVSDHPAWLSTIILDNSLNHRQLIKNTHDWKIIVILYNQIYDFMLNPRSKKTLLAGFSWMLLILNFLKDIGCEDREIYEIFLMTIIQSCRLYPTLHRRIIPAINQDSFYYQNLFAPVLQALSLKPSWEYPNGMKFALGWIFLQQSCFYLKVMPVLVKNPYLLPVNIRLMIKTIGILLLKYFHEELDALPGLMEFLAKKPSGQEEKSDSDRLNRYSTDNHVSILQTRHTAACSLQRPLMRTALLKPDDADLKNYAEACRRHQLKTRSQNI